MIQMIIQASQTQLLMTLHQFYLYQGRNNVILIFIFIFRYSFQNSFQLPMEYDKIQILVYSYFGMTRVRQLISQFLHDLRVRICLEVISSVGFQLANLLMDIWRSDKLKNGCHFLLICVGTQLTLLCFTPVSHATMHEWSWHISSIGKEYSQKNEIKKNEEQKKIYKLSKTKDKVIGTKELGRPNIGGKKKLIQHNHKKPLPHRDPFMPQDTREPKSVHEKNNCVESQKINPT